MNSGQNQPAGDMSNSVEDTQIAAVSSRVLKLPVFCKQNPRLWFAQIELLFANNNIVSDLSKFRHVATQLSGEVLDCTSDIVLTPPEENKFETLKKRIMTAFEEGEEKRLRRVLHGNEMKDERPTVYLHRLRNLAAGQCSEAILRSLFLEQLPEQLRTVLIVADTGSLDCLANMADKMMDVIKLNISAVSEGNVMKTSLEKVVSPEQGKLEMLEKAICSLTLQVTELTKKLNKQFQNKRQFNKFAQKNRSRSRTPASASESKQNENLACYFHETFGTNARKCVLPCSWWKAQEN